MLIERVVRSVPHPSRTDLVYVDDRGLSVEQVVDDALGFRPVPLDDLIAHGGVWGDGER